MVSAWALVAWIPAADAQLHGRQETRSGVLEFEASGYPTDATVKRVREEIDYQRAVQAYIHFIPAVAMMPWRNGHLGPLGGKAGDMIVYFRRHSPTKAFFDRSWKMGNIVEVK